MITILEVKPQIRLTIEYFMSMSDGQGPNNLTYKQNGDNNIYYVFYYFLNEK